MLQLVLQRRIDALPGRHLCTREHPVSVSARAYCWPRHLGPRRQMRFRGACEWGCPCVFQGHPHSPGPMIELATRCRGRRSPLSSERNRPVDPICHSRHPSHPNTSAQVPGIHQPHACAACQKASAGWRRMSWRAGGVAGAPSVAIAGRSRLGPLEVLLVHDPRSSGARFPGSDPAAKVLAARCGGSEGWTSTAMIPTLARASAWSRTGPPRRLTSGQWPVSCVIAVAASGVKSKKPSTPARLNSLCT